MPPRARKATRSSARKGPRKSISEDTSVTSPEPESSLSTASSSSYKPSSSATPTPNAAPASSAAPSSPPPPTPAKGPKGKGSSRQPYTSSIYQVQSDDAVGSHDWAKYVGSLRCRVSIFGALRGTVSERYSSIEADTARRERRRYLEEEQIRVLLAVASEHHNKNCDTCDESGKISADCLRKTDAKMVKHGLNEIMLHREYYRPDEPSKNALEVGFSRARFRGDVEVKSIMNLNYLYPYMSYQPGEYLVRLMPLNEATDQQKAIGIRMQPYSEHYSMFNLNDDILVPDGIVPYKPEEDLERFDTIALDVLRIIVAILGFKPGATDFVPKTLRVPFEATSAPVEGWEELVEAWDNKFEKVSGLPKFIHHSVVEARTKLSEAAWLIRRLRGHDGLTDYSSDRDAQFDTMEQLLCRVAGTSFDELADQHLKQLGAEALEYLNDGDNDKVLVYSSGSWPKDFKDIHSFYRTNSGFPRPAPLEPERLEAFRRAALRIIDSQDEANHIRSEVTRLLFELKFLHPGDDGNDDTRATTVAADEEPLPPPASEPGPSAQSETPRKKRGRPPKNPGDPKAPYRKKQKLDQASSQTANAS